MDASLALSIIGLGFSLATNPVYGIELVQKPGPFVLQKLEGKKSCDFADIKVLSKNDKTIYLKYKNVVYTMHRKPTAKGVKNVKRFETEKRNLVFLQLPEKAMLLDHVNMRPLLNECLDV